MAIGMGLTAKQERFCREYLVDMNATQAAVRAGYSEKTAHSCGPRLMDNAGVIKKIRVLTDERARSLEITAERVLKELARVAFADPGDIVKVDERGRVKVTPTEQLTEDQRRAIQSVSQTADGVKIKMGDKLRALELVGKHIGLFIDRVEVHGNVRTETEEMPDAELDKILEGK